MNKLQLFGWLYFRNTRFRVVAHLYTIQGFRMGSRRQPCFGQGREGVRTSRFDIAIRKHEIKRTHETCTWKCIARKIKAKSSIDLVGITCRRLEGWVEIGVQRDIDQCCKVEIERYYFGRYQIWVPVCLMFICFQYFGVCTWAPKRFQTLLLLQA